MSCSTVCKGDHPTKPHVNIECYSEQQLTSTTSSKLIDMQLVCSHEEEEQENFTLYNEPHRVRRAEVLGSRVQM